jgi:hypothetical protein
MVYYRVKEKLYILIYYIPTLFGIYFSVWSLYIRIELPDYRDFLTIY